MQNVKSEGKRSRPGTWQVAATISGTRAGGRRPAGRLFRRTRRQPGAAARDRRHRQILSTNNANHGGRSQPAARAMHARHRAHKPPPISSSPPIRNRSASANMTTFTLPSAGPWATWKAGDEILAHALDHDANVTPWVLAARDAGPWFATSTADEGLHVRPSTSCVRALCRGRAGGRGLCVECRWHR